MPYTDAFRGNTDSTTKVTVTTTRQPTALKGLPNDPRSFQVRVVNKSGGSDVWLKFGNDTTTVTATVNASRIIPAGNTEVFSVAAGMTCFDAITESGTATLYIETGEGV